MIKRALAGMGLIGCIWLVAGCAEVVVPGTIAGGGEAYHYTTDNAAKRTFVSSLNQVTTAAQKALKKMDIRYIPASPGVYETEIKASTG